MYFYAIFFKMNTVGNDFRPLFLIFNYSFFSIGQMLSLFYSCDFLKNKFKDQKSCQQILLLINFYYFLYDFKSKKYSVIIRTLGVSTFWIKLIVW